MVLITEEIGNLNWEMEAIKMEILQLKSIVTEMFQIHYKDTEVQQHRKKKKKKKQLSCI